MTKEQQEPVRPRPDPAALAGLRARIEAIERAGMPAAAAADGLRLGVPVLDAALLGGLPRGRLHDIHGGAASDGAASGFAVMLLARLTDRAGAPALWCQPRHGRALPYAPGLSLFGLDPARLILARPSGDADTFWAMEEGLRCGRLAAVVGAPRRTVPPAVARRLQLAAREGGVSALLLLAPGVATGGTAATAWRVTAAPGSAPLRPFASPFGQPRWQIELLRARGGRPGSWLMDWNHETGALALAADLPDRPAAVLRRAG